MLHDYSCPVKYSNIDGNIPISVIFLEFWEKRSVISSHFTELALEITEMRCKKR